MAPLGQIGASRSTSSQTTASIEPVTSPRRSFRKTSPLRRWRLLWALTTKIELTS